MKKFLFISFCLFSLISQGSNLRKTGKTKLEAKKLLIAKKLHMAFLTGGSLDLVKKIIKKTSVKDLKAIQSYFSALVKIGKRAEVQAFDEILSLSSPEKFKSKQEEMSLINNNKEIAKKIISVLKALIKKRKRSKSRLVVYDHKNIRSRL